MIERITITDFAVARSVVIEPGPGLNVFTGETGAGKSLVVDALAFLFGGRRGREIIATGAERATVEAVLSLPEGVVKVERTVSAAGRSSARLNGQPASLDDLRELGARAIDIHGQSEQLAILRPAVQLRVLDEFAGLEGKRDALGGEVRELRDVRRRISALMSDSRERERLVDQLRFETEEISAAALERGEDIALRDDLRRLSNPERLLEAANRAIEALGAAPIAEAVRAVSELTTRDPGAADAGELASALDATVAELSRALRRYRDGIEDDPERLAAVQDRLDLIARLCRKYGDSVDEVVAYGERAAGRLAELTGAAASVEELLVREQELLDSIARDGAGLSLARRESARTLVQEIARKLEGLGMGAAGLAVGFACEDDPAGARASLPEYEVVGVGAEPSGACDVRPLAVAEAGLDRLEFLASFNPGELPRPLSAVASGGETSRFLLALTTVLGAQAERRSVVLDEADEGVGGRSGVLVGRALLDLARQHQVFCITHLPQVAAFGHHHFVVTKASGEGRTWSEVRAVSGQARVEELAAMLGGVTAANRAAAEELLASVG